MTTGVERARLERLSAGVAALHVDELAAEVVTALRAKGVSSILLEGPSVAGWLYADDSPRSYADVDLLVAPARHSRAEDALAELGFSPVLGDEDTPGWRLAAHVWVRPDGAEVDLHRTLVGVGADASDVWQTLWGTSEPMRVGGLEVEVLSVPARAFQLALHATQHGRDDGRRLEDLHRALRAATFHDWSEAARLADRLDATPAFSAGLRLLPAGASLADRLGLPPGGSTADVLRASSPPRGALGLEALARARGARAKLSLIGRNLVPSSRFMRVWSPLARRGKLGLAAAYVWRPIAIALRAGPAGVAWLRAHRLSRRAS